MFHRKSSTPIRASDEGVGDSGASLDCPICGYDLRGFAEPRCPECGVPFDIRQLQAGTVRVERPTWFDSADPWQPHQLLVRSLVELVRGLFRPNRRLRHVAVRADPWNGVRMLVCAECWIAFFCALVLSAAMVMRTGTSPAAAVRTAAWVWTPALFAVRASLYLFLVWAAVDARLLRVADVPFRNRAAVAGYWMPIFGFWCSTLQVGLIAAEPQFGLPMAWIAPGLAALSALVSLLRSAGPRLRSVAPLAAVWCILAGCAASAVSRLTLPDTLPPPLWVLVP